MSNMRVNGALMVSIVIAAFSLLHAASANVLCERKSCLVAQDINGIRLGMTVQQVAQLLPTGLKPIGGGDYEADGRNVTYNFGFTPLGHLYRIDSSQILGRFQPDHEFGLRLSAKLIAKYGPPETNQLPGGPAFWNLVQYVQTAQGTLLMRPTESLSAALNGGYGLPIKLELKLMDFRILRRDNATMNSVPETRAAKHVQF